MPNTTFNAIYEGALSLAGIVPANVPTDTAAALRRAINLRMPWAWRFWQWPDTMRCDLRAWAEDWSASTTYAEDDIVYDETTAAYYISLQGTNLNHAVTDASWWEVTTEITPPEIIYEQAAKDAIGDVFLMSPDNPDEVEHPRRLRFRLTDTGVRGLGPGVPATVYLVYRLPVPVLVGATFDAAATYTAGKTLYYSSATAGYEGDYWITTAATTAGQDPEDTPSKWTRLAIPQVLEQPLIRAAYEDVLRGDGQRDSAGAERPMSQDELERAALGLPRAA